MSRLWTLIKCKWKWSVYQVGCVYYVILLISQLFSTVTKLQRHQVAVLWKVPIHKKKTALFGVITRRIVVIFYRRFGTNSWSLLRGPRTGLCWIIDPWRWDRYVVQERRKKWPLHPHNYPEELSSLLLGGGSLKWRISIVYNFCCLLNFIAPMCVMMQSVCSVWLAIIGRGVKGTAWR
jgi:hypothetical protein